MKWLEEENNMMKILQEFLLSQYFHYSLLPWSGEWFGEKIVRVRILKKFLRNLIVWGFAFILLVVRVCALLSHEVVGIWEQEKRRIFLKLNTTTF